MKRIQLIEKQGNKFLLNILGVECTFCKKDLWVNNNLFCKKATVKGSTYGWNFGNSFISYNQIKEAICQNQQLELKKP